MKDTKDYATVLGRSIDLRVETFQKVLSGEMTRLERRLKIARQTQEIVFRGIRSYPDNTTVKNDVDKLSSDSDQPDVNLEQHEPQESISEDHAGEESVDPKAASKVEIEVDSATEDEIRAANLLTEKHPGAETVAILDDGSIEVRDTPGGTFAISATDALHSESNEYPETQESSVPSMSTAAAERFT